MESNSSPSTEDSKDWSDSVPRALTPVYKPGEPNQPILLDDEPLQIAQEINQHPVKIQGHGSVKYAWFPSPCIKFEFANHHPAYLVDFHAQSTSLTLSDFATLVEVLLEKSNLDGIGNNQVWGRAKAPIEKGAGQDLVYVLFHVANFHDFIGSCNTIVQQDSDQRSGSLNRITFKVEY